MPTLKFLKPQAKEQLMNGKERNKLKLLQCWACIFIRCKTLLVLLKVLHLIWFFEYGLIQAPVNNTNAHEAVLWWLWWQPIGTNEPVVITHIVESRSSELPEYRILSKDLALQASHWLYIRLATTKPILSFAHIVFEFTAKLIWAEFQFVIQTAAN